MGEIKDKPVTQDEALTIEEAYKKLKEAYHMAEQQYKMLFEEYKKVSEQAFYKKLEFNFKVIENADKFNKEFVERISKEIEEALTVQEQEEEK